VILAMQRIKLASLKFDSEADVVVAGSIGEPKMWLNNMLLSSSIPQACSDQISDATVEFILFHNSHLEKKKHT